MPRSAHGKHGRHGKKTGRRVEKERPRTAKADQLAKAWVVRNLAEKTGPFGRDGVYPKSDRLRAVAGRVRLPVGGRQLAGERYGP